MAEAPALREAETGRTMKRMSSFWSISAKLVNIPSIRPEDRPLADLKAPESDGRALSLQEPNVPFLPRSPLPP